MAAAPPRRPVNGHAAPRHREESALGLRLGRWRDGTRRRPVERARERGHHCRLSSRASGASAQRLCLAERRGSPSFRSEALGCCTRVNDKRCAAAAWSWDSFWLAVSRRWLWSKALRSESQHFIVKRGRETGGLRTLWTGSSSAKTPYGGRTKKNQVQRAQQKQHAAPRTCSHPRNRHTRQRGRPEQTYPN